MSATAPRSRPGAARAACAALALTALLALPLGAQAPRGAAPEAGPALSDSAIDAQTRAIASQLRCVVCQGLSVEDSPSELAQEMKRLVREQVAEGRTPEEIKAYFVGRYGEFVLLAPEPRGFNLVVYLLPVFALLAGAAVLAHAVRGWTRPGPDPDEGEIGAAARTEEPEQVL